MQLFDCPWCGPRPHIEFTYLRDSESVATGSLSAGADDRRDLDRIYLRRNHPGVHTEIWQHSFGCRGWLRIARNNLTHEVGECLPVSPEPMP
ncbi:MAG: sarcosine oxidase subunit delta [Gammaproteobacteria bacterium]|nr:sarcosine oxidase subunit delta [Gammaproteobacteria bacterium]